MYSIPYCFTGYGVSKILNFTQTPERSVQNEHWMAHRPHFLGCVLFAP